MEYLIPTILYASASEEFTKKIKKEQEFSDPPSGDAASAITTHIISSVGEYRGKETKIKDNI